VRRKKGRKKKVIEKEDLKKLPDLDVIEDEREIEEIVEWDKRINCKGFVALNTPWATNKHGKRDPINLALFIELETNDGETYYWLISEEEIKKIGDLYKNIKRYNMTHNHQGQEFQKKFG